MVQPNKILRGCIWPVGPRFATSGIKACVVPPCLDMDSTPRNLGHEEDRTVVDEELAVRTKLG